MNLFAMRTLEVGGQSLGLLKGSDKQRPLLHRIDRLLHVRFRFNNTAMHAATQAASWSSSLLLLEHHYIYRQVAMKMTSPKIKLNENILPIIRRRSNVNRCCHRHHRPAGF